MFSGVPAAAWRLHGRRFEQCCLMQDLAGSAEDARVLRALWNIFHALRAPREDLPESLPPGPGGSALANGEHTKHAPACHKHRHIVSWTSKDTPPPAADMDVVASSPSRVVTFCCGY